MKDTHSELEKLWAELSDNKPYPVEDLYTHVIAEGKRNREDYWSIYDKLVHHELDPSIVYFDNASPIDILEMIEDFCKKLTLTLNQIWKVSWHTTSTMKSTRRFSNLITGVSGDLEYIQDKIEMVNNDIDLFHFHFPWKYTDTSFRQHPPSYDSEYYKYQKN